MFDRSSRTSVKLKRFLFELHWLEFQRASEKHDLSFLMKFLDFIRFIRFYLRRQVVIRMSLTT